MADFDDNADQLRLTESSRSGRKVGARARDFGLEVRNVVAEGETGNPGRRPDAVGLHAGHDL
jgi:hypothetical protein